MCFKKEIPTSFSYRAVSNKPPFVGAWEQPQTAATLRARYHCLCLPYTLSISFGHFQLVLSVLCGH